jgi:hypothetical protein
MFLFLFFIMIFLGMLPFSFSFAPLDFLPRHQFLRQSITIPSPELFNSFVPCS